MQKITLLFTRSYKPLSLIIQGLTMSRWSHVGILTKEGTLIEAKFPRVRETKLEDAFLRGGRWEMAEIECKDPDAAITAARTQIGKPYDWTALFGFLSGRDWEKVGRWFCSELATWAISQGGTRLFRLEAQSRVTPGDLWMISERIDVGLTGSISRATMDIRP